MLECLQRVSPSTKSRVVQAARDWVEKSIEGRWVLNSFDRHRLDLPGSEEVEVDSRDGGRHGLGDVHDVCCCAGRARMRHGARCLEASVEVPRIVQRKPKRMLGEAMTGTQGLSGLQAVLGAEG